MSSVAVVIGALRVNPRLYFGLVLPAILDLCSKLSVVTIRLKVKNFSRRHSEILCLFFSENITPHVMEIVSFGDNLDEMSNTVVWENINLSSVGFKARRRVINTLVSQL